MARFYIYTPHIGFLNDESGSIPDGALPITEEKFNELFTAQSKGKVIVTDAMGNLSAENPPPPPPVPVFRRYSSLEFFNLFTSNEMDQIAEFARTNNQAMIWLMQATGASYIDLDDVKTSQGLQFLVSLDILTSQRMFEILNTGK